MEFIQMLTTRDVAEATGQHVKTVLRHIKQGKLKAVKFDKEYRIHAIDFCAYRNTINK